MCPCINTRTNTEIYTYISVSTPSIPLVLPPTELQRTGFGCAPLEASVRLECGARCANWEPAGGTALPAGGGLLHRGCWPGPSISSVSGWGKPSSLGPFVVLETFCEILEHGHSLGTGIPIPSHHPHPALELQAGGGQRQTTACLLLWLLPKCQALDGPKK